MAARLGIDPQRLQQFITDSPWDEEQVWRVVRQEVIPHFEPIEAWIVDETGWCAVPRLFVETGQVQRRIVS